MIVLNGFLAAEFPWRILEFYQSRFVAGYFEAAPKPFIPRFSKADSID
jgi:hypothetical protein